jgi:hypothetical protein
MGHLIFGGWETVEKRNPWSVPGNPVTKVHHLNYFKPLANLQFWVDAGPLAADWTRIARLVTHPAQLLQICHI